MSRSNLFIFIADRRIGCPLSSSLYVGIRRNNKQVISSGDEKAIISLYSTEVEVLGLIRKEIHLNSVV